MADYQKMYYILCDNISKALDLLPPTPVNRPAQKLLQDALMQAEELYIETADTPHRL